MYLCALLVGSVMCMNRKSSVKSNPSLLTGNSWFSGMRDPGSDPGVVFYRDSNP